MTSGGGGARAVLDERELDAPIGCVVGLEEMLAALARAEELSEPGLYIRGGAEHNLLIRGDGLLESGILNADVVADTAIVQDRPVDSEADEAGNESASKVSPRSELRPFSKVLLAKPVLPLMVMLG